MKLFTKIKFYILSLFIISGFTWLNTIAMETNTQVEKEKDEDKNALVTISSSVMDLAKSAKTDLAQTVSMPKDPNIQEIREYLSSRLHPMILKVLTDDVIMTIFDAGKAFTLNGEIGTNIKNLGEKIYILEEVVNRNTGHYSSTRELLIKDITLLKANFQWLLIIIKNNISKLEKQNKVINDRVKWLFILYFYHAKKAEKVIFTVGKINGTVDQHSSRLNEYNQRLASQEVSLRNTAETVGNTYGTVSQHSERIHGLEERTRELEGSILSLNNLNKLLEGDWAKTLEMMSYIGYPTMSYSNKILGTIPVINKFSGAMEDTFKKLSAFFLLYRTGKLCAPWIKSMLYSSITKKLKSLSPNIYDLLLGLNQSKDNSYCGRF